MDRPLCIYHGNCADGFGAAWVVRKALSNNVDFHAGVYQDAPPDVHNREVLMVDFSYKRDVLLLVNHSARSVLILDHHKSAVEDLGHLQSESPPRDWSDWRTRWDALPSAAAIFDMNRSGAGIAWDFFFPGQPRPALINHIEDRDLWRFALPGTREIQAAVFSHPYDFGLWDDLMSCDLATLRGEGAAIERKHFKDIAELTKVVTRPMKIGGHVVPAANLPYTLTSDAGHALAKGQPFAACYWDTPDGRVFSLRSTDDGLDVSEIAKLYGGGGHAHAAGFRVAYDALAQFEPAP